MPQHDEAPADSAALEATTPDMAPEALRLLSGASGKSAACLWCGPGGQCRELSHAPASIYPSSM
jgi:hypothetical protein